MKTRVMCFGTFDIVHPGHVHFFSAARALGDELYVVISQDKRRTALSGKKPVHTQKERALMVEALKSVTRAVIGDARDMMKPLKTYKPHIVVLGHDQTAGVDLLRTWITQQKNKPQIVRLKAFKRARFSTSRIKSELCR